MEVKIGRNVDGKHDVLVPDQFKKVSRVHAKLELKNGSFILHDMESANGTYVNGQRIFKKEINTENDTVLLGDTDETNAYKLDLEKISKMMSDEERSSRTDFSEEFLNLVKVYNDYNNELNAFRRKEQLKSQIPKIGISVGIALLLLVIKHLGFIPDDYKDMIYPLMLIVMGIAGVFTLMSSSPDIREKQIEIELKYQNNYCCPKCKKIFNLNIHWKKLLNQKYCPHNCGAQFLKQ